MTSSYQVLGTSIAPMHGRSRQIAEIDASILKKTPDHVQVIGPPLIGKSVFLNALAKRFGDENQYFVSAAYVDLRHAPPEDDEAFRRTLATIVRSSLQKRRPDIAELIATTGDNVYESLEYAFEQLIERNERLLMVLDGFDHVLSGTGITREFWGSLRKLAGKASLCLVTGSRATLLELCHTEESRASHLWELFNCELELGPFDEQDWRDLLEPLLRRHVGFDSSARKELVNWAGGVPVLAAALMIRIEDQVGAGATVTKADVDGAAKQLLAHPPPALESLWKQCDVDLRNEIATLAANEAKGVAASDLAAPRKRALEARGYVGISGGRARLICRLIGCYADLQSPGLTDLKRLFGRGDLFDKNIQDLLELRLSQVAEAGPDAHLLSLIRTAIRSIHPRPAVALNLVRDIAASALSIVWSAEFGTELTVPDEWVKEWEYAENKKLTWLAGGVPRGGAQCQLLRLMVGKENVKRRARVVTRTTYHLIEALYSIGDFGAHRLDYPECTVSTGFAATAALMAIEMTDSLYRDLQGGQLLAGPRA